VCVCVCACVHVHMCVHMRSHGVTLYIIMAPNARYNVITLFIKCALITLCPMARSLTGWLSYRTMMFLVVSALYALCVVAGLQLYV